MKNTLTTILSVIILLVVSHRLYANTDVESLVFTRVNISGGTANRHVQHVLQADDGRMVITSSGYVDIYDGARFRHIVTDESVQTELKDCKTPYTVYCDNHDRVWFKCSFAGRCLDMRSEKYIQPLDSLFCKHGIHGEVTDFYCDQQGEMWVLADGYVINLDNPSQRIHTDKVWGNITNLQTLKGRLYLFFSQGMVKVFDCKTLRSLFTASPMMEKYHDAYGAQCQVIQSGNGTMYVCHSGKGKGVVMAYDTGNGKWTEILRTNTILHGGTAYGATHVMVATPDRIYDINTLSGSVSLIEKFNLQGKWFPLKHFNWIYSDAQGGTWLGSYNDGLFYAHPLREQKYSIEGSDTVADRTVSPLHLTIASVSINGTRLAIGDRHLPEAEKYVRDYTLDYDENSISFEISALNYALPSITKYSYKLVEESAAEDTVTWHDATKENGMVDDNGLFLLSLSNLKPGGYRLVVTATCGKGSDTLTIRINVKAPWWNTTTAHVAYILAIFFIIVLITVLSRVYDKRQTLRKRKEERLLNQIRDLINRCNEYEKMYADSKTEDCQQEQDVKEEESSLSDADREFIRRAVRLVEENMSTGNYTVEQLSRDMCMERTGLYKKMTAMVEQTPSAFIRSIRLQKAMDMLKSGDYTVGEVAQRTGFSTTSYFCKVFMAEYGKNPVEYLKK